MSNPKKQKKTANEAIFGPKGHAVDSGGASNAILVLGMHRSGTSATTRVLNFLGAELGPNLLGPGFSNKLGFWEHLDAYKINDGLLHSMGRSWNDVRPLPDRWQDSPRYSEALRDIVEVLKRDFGHSRLWAVKDPRLCRLVPLWREALDQMRVRTTAVIVLRHPREVAGSLGVRDGLSREHVNLLWARHLLDAERTTRDIPRCVVSYESLLENWRLESSRIARLIGVEWPNAAEQVSDDVDGFLDKGQRHHTRREDNGPSPESDWIDRLYEAFRAAATDEGGLAEIAVMEKQFEGISTLFDSYLDEVVNRLEAGDKRLAEMTSIESILAPMSLQVADASDAVAKLVDIVNRQSSEISVLTEGDAGVVRSLINSLNQRIVDLEGGIFERERQIGEFREQLSAYTERREQQASINAKLESRIQELEKERANSESEVVSLRVKLADMASIRAEQAAFIESIAGVVEGLERSLSESAQAQTATAERLMVSEQMVVDLQEYIEANKPWYRKFIARKK